MYNIIRVQSGDGWLTEVLNYNIICIGKVFPNGKVVANFGGDNLIIQVPLSDSMVKAVRSSIKYPIIAYAHIRDNTVIALSNEIYDMGLVPLDLEIDYLKYIIVSDCINKCSSAYRTVDYTFPMLNEFYRVIYTVDQDPYKSLSRVM